MAQTNKFTMVWPLFGNIHVPRLATSRASMPEPRPVAGERPPVMPGRQPDLFGASQPDLFDML